MHIRTPRAADLAALALLAACADQPTAPGTPSAPNAVPAFAVSPSGATLVSNTVKYSDGGLKATSARAGSAAITAQALIGSDNVTELRVTSSAASGGGAAGRLDKVKTKAFDWNDEQIFTRTHTGTGGPTLVQSYPDLAWGSRLQVQANVSGIDPSRTDVVEAAVPVLLRPDLSVGFWWTPRARVGEPTVLEATVYEANGQVGARADCVLYVDGAEVDRSAGMWVDAGGLVTCAFTHRFTAEGTRFVEVAVENVNPGDWSTDNNRAGRTVVVVAADNHFESASATDHSFETRSSYTYEWADRVSGNNGQYANSFNHLSRQQYASAYGSSSIGFSGPFTVTASQVSGGQTVHSAVFEMPDVVEGDYSCRSWFDGAAGVFFYVCTGDFGVFEQTTFRYDHQAGSVTYHSTEYSRQWDAYTGTEYVYNFNSSDTGTTGTFFPLGADYGFRLRFAGADKAFESNVTFPLTASETVVHDNPNSCYLYDDPSYYVKSCSQYFARQTGAIGYWPPFNF
jgi:hypothetical protein